MIRARDRSCAAFPFDYGGGDPFGGALSPFGGGGALSPFGGFGGALSPFGGGGPLTGTLQQALANLNQVPVPFVNRSIDENI